MENDRIVVTCPCCDRRMTVGARLQGRTVRCGQCTEIVRVPVRTRTKSLSKATKGDAAAATPQPSAVVVERRKLQVHAAISAVVTAVVLGAFGLTAMRGHLYPALMLPLIGAIGVLTRSALRLDAIDKVLTSSGDREAAVARRRAMAGSSV